jgi:hypothetical protein
MGFPRAASGDWFISTYFAHPNDTLLYKSSLISDIDKDKLKAFKEEDNPMLVFFQLKDF